MCVVLVGLPVGQSCWSQLPIWMREASWVEERSCRVESWSGGESLRLHQACLLRNNHIFSSEWLQIGGYVATGLSAGHTVELAPQLNLQANAGFRIHRWRTATDVRRRMQPEIEATLRADLDTNNRLCLAFRFSPHGAIPRSQTRDEMSIQGDWVLTRGSYSARATVNWSNRGTALQWRLMHRLEGYGVVGLHWMLLSGFLGIEWRVNGPSTLWSVSILGSAQVKSSVMRTEWRW